MENTLHTQNTLWSIRLFDGPVLQDASGKEIRRFRYQRAGALLAYLALHLDRPCSREELCDALWPGEVYEVAANRLRVVLASLRRQLEPAGTAFGTVLDVGTPGCILLRGAAAWCDVIAFEQALQKTQREAAAQLARGTLLPGYYDEWVLIARQRYEALSEDLGEPSYEAGADTERTTAVDPVVSSAQIPPRNRLPLYLTRFFGRQKEQQQLLDLIAANRLVTVTGSGGVGKTRLAVETARQMPQHCIFVPLADLPDPERVPEAVLEALLISPQAQADPIAQLIEALQNRDPVLLILDNAEHLLSAVVTLSLQLLEAVPELRLLVTSRHRLNVAGEALFPLTPLEPPPHASLPERLEEFPAIALFVDRARNALPDFALLPRHVDALVEICHRLEGMPLALELAAARVTAQTPAQIASALTTSLTDLKSRQRGLSPRHQSLRAAIQFSLDLLTPDLQAFVTRLSVFQGGWTAEAARAVTGCTEAEEFLEELVTRSLVTAREHEATGVMRYSFLETLRQFVTEQLSEADRESSARLHADYFLALASAVDEDDIRTLRPLDAEQENLRAAVEHGWTMQSRAFWPGLAGALIHAFVRGHHRIALGWIEKALPAVVTVPDAAARFRVRYAACKILPDIGRLAEARRAALAMKEDAEANGDAVAAVYAEIELGYVEENQGQLETAVHMQREALQRARSLANTPLMLAALSHASGVLHAYGVVLGMETEAGRAVLQEAEALAWELLALVPPFSRRVSLAHQMLAPTLFFQQRVDEAYAELKKAQAVSIAHGTMTELMYSFAYESQIAAVKGSYKAAALLFGAFLNLQERMGYSLDRAQSYRPTWVQKLTDDLRARLGGDTFDFLVRCGRQTPPEEFAAKSLSEISLP